MIVRDLLIKLGFRADTAGLDKTDAKIKGMKGGLDVLKVAAGNVLANLAQSGVGKAVDVVREGVQESMDFGREMANISSLIGGNQARTQELAKGYAALAQEFGGSVHDIAKGGYELIGSLGDSADHMERLRSAMILGKAGAGDMAQGFSLLRVATSSYGDTSAAAFKRAADLSAQAVNLGVVTMPQLASVFGGVAPLASQLGVSLEEAYGSLAAMTSIVEPGEAATQMGAALSALIDRSKAMDKAFRKAFGGEGIKTAKQAIGKYGLQGVLAKVASTTDGTEEAVNALFGRKEAMRFTISMVGNLKGKYEDVMQGMKDAGGAAEAMAKAQTTGMGAAAFAADKLKASNEALSISIGKKAEPAFLGLESTGLRIKSLFADYILPLFSDVNVFSSDAGEGIDLLKLSFQGLSFVLTGVIGALDTILTTGRLIGTVIGGLVASLGLAAKGDLSGAGNALSKMQDDVSKIWGGYTGRSEQYSAIIEGRSAIGAEVPERARAGMAPAVGGGGGGGGLMWTNTGDTNITINAAPGTEAAAAAREVDAAVRNSWDQNLMQAHSALSGDY
jgi:hypothetical protein